MSYANYSALISCPQTCADAEIAYMTLTWLDLYLPPSHYLLSFLLLPPLFSVHRLSLL